MNRQLRESCVGCKLVVCATIIASDFFGVFGVSRAGVPLHSLTLLLHSVVLDGMGILGLLFPSIKNSNQDGCSSESFVCWVMEDEARAQFLTSSHPKTSNSTPPPDLPPTKHTLTNQRGVLNA